MPTRDETHLDTRTPDVHSLHWSHAHRTRLPVAIGHRHVSLDGTAVCRRPELIRGMGLMSHNAMDGPRDTLDRIDRLLLTALQEDARTPISKLARLVQLTETPCRLRLKRLEREGFIDSFGACINAERAGFALLAYISVSVERGRPECLEQFHSIVREVEEIQECQMTAGGFDYLLKVRAWSMADFSRIVNSRLLSLVGLKHSQTFFVVDKIKSQSRLNLRAAHPAATRARRKVPRKRTRTKEPPF